MVGRAGTESKGTNIALNCKKEDVVERLDRLHSEGTKYIEENSRH